MSAVKQPRCAIYARVSTDEQHTENQIPVLREMAERRGWKVIKVYAEEASAWKNGRQKELKQLFIDASYHKYDFILIWALDRLSREGISTLLSHVLNFTKYGATVVSNQESWLEQSGPMKELLISIFGWNAEFESKRRSERIKAAMAKRRSEGKSVGRQPGSKDKKPRKTMGYIVRFADRRK